MRHQGELSQLERGDKKIDHPATAGASKDVADCLAACVYHCEESWRRGEASKGLFQMGVVEQPGEISEPLKAKLDAISAMIARGEQLGDSDEDLHLFMRLFPDMYEADGTLKQNLPPHKDAPEKK